MTYWTGAAAQREAQQRKPQSQPSTPPDEKLGRESMCKPDAGDISATEGVQTRSEQQELADLAMRIWRGMGCIDDPCKSLPGCGCVDFIVRQLEDHALRGEAATAIRSLTEERRELRQALLNIEGKCAAWAKNEMGHAAAMAEISYTARIALARNPLNEQESITKETTK